MSVTLLIGANCPKALEPQNVIHSQNGGPYAVKSILGWYVTGPLVQTNPTSTFACHRIMAEVKEVSIHEQLAAMYQMDFNEPQLSLKSPVTSVKGATLSINDQKFLNIMETKATMESSHYVLRQRKPRHQQGTSDNKSSMVETKIPKGQSILRTLQLFHERNHLERLR